MLAPWQRAARLCGHLTLAVGLAMIVYVGIAVFGLVRSSAQHYATFLLFVMVMSSLVAFKALAAERLVAARATPWWRLRGALALAGAAVLLTNRPAAVIPFLLAAVGLSAAALAIPEFAGYCKSPKMPCNYGTLPAVRLVSLSTAILSLLALGGALRNAIRKDRS